MISAALKRLGTAADVRRRVDRLFPAGVVLPPERRKQSDRRGLPQALHLPKLRQARLLQAVEALKAGQQDFAQGRADAWDRLELGAVSCDEEPLGALLLFRERRLRGGA